MMSELPEPWEREEESVHRCPQCDSVIAAEAAQCIICGQVFEGAATADPQTAVSDSPPPPSPTTPTAAPAVFESVMRERQSRATFLLTAVFAIIIIVLGTLVWRYQGPVLHVALVPSATPLPPTPTYTPTWTPLPTEIVPPTATPTQTPTPAPTATPQPDRLHNLASGETLFGLSLIYNVSADSIAELNGLSVDSPIQAGQALLIPWPTATPPLEPIALDINGETVIADPTNCERHQIQEGDSVASIAGQYGIDLELLLNINRLTGDSIVQPGDTLCIPEIIFGELVSTPGALPTMTPTRFPPGPRLLYPVDGVVIDPPDGVVTLQWVAVKDLTEAEWYMITVDDLTVLDVPPYRGFTRDNSFQVPHHWRPVVPETHTFQWQVSIVRVTDWRADGQPIYTYGGLSSDPASFTWLGAIPTPTPTMTPTPTPTPES